MKEHHKKHVHRTLYFAPRIFALIVGLFFLTMLFDLKHGFSTWQLLGALLPGLVVIAAIILTWNKPRRASLLFAVLTLIYTIVGWFVLQDNVIGTITVPLIIISALLIINAKSHLLV
jgi:predicted anti-sigma-YlaC factor YlaD